MPVASVVAGHLPVQGIDLFDEVPLAQAAYRRIARHKGNPVEIHGQKKGLCAHAARCERCFTARVSRTDYDNIKHAFSHRLFEKLLVFGRPKR